MHAARPSVLRRFRWPLAGLLLSIVGLAPISPWEPWIVTRLGIWFEVWGFFLVLALTAFGGGIIEGLRFRRNWVVAVTSVLVPALIVASYRWIDMPALTLEQWKLFFKTHSNDWKEAEAWFRATTISDQSLTKELIPEPLRSVSSGGRILVRTDAKGVKWIGICVASQGIDNDRVFLWSKEGGVPPEDAYPVIVKAWSMGGGWYFARTT